MRNLSLSFLTTLFLLGFSACSKDYEVKNEPVKETDYSPLSNASNVGRINFDNALSPKERGAFVAALDYLRATEILNADSELLSMMRIGRADYPTVSSWLEDRVQFIAPNGVSENRVSTISKNYTNYQNPGVFPVDFKKPAHAVSENNIVMSNIGGVIYLIGKADSELLGFDAQGHGTIPATSPRMGILEIGGGLFMIPSKYTNAVKVFHLTMLMHESRHSDGNGLATGFMHAKCPSGEFQGEAACDHNTNGPYTIETLATKALMNNCSECSAGDRKIIELLYADVSDRVIHDNDLKQWDDTPEGRRE